MSISFRSYCFSGMLLLLLGSVLGCQTQSNTLPTIASPNETAPSSTMPAATRTIPPPAVSIATATLSSTATAAPNLLLPGALPPNVNPLTGLVVSDLASLHRRPLAIKISHFPRYVRPQAGLQAADLVFEHYAEGGTARFTAIFYVNAPERVGPVRSARLIDTVIPEMVDGALVTSGSSSGTMQRLLYKPWYERIIAEQTGAKCPLLCRESEDTNSVFASTQALWQTLTEKNQNTLPRIHGGFAFSGSLPAGGQPLLSAQVAYSSECVSEWRYDASQQRYLRWVESDVAGQLVPHLEQTDNSQLAAENMVILFVNHVVDQTVPEDYDTDGYRGHFASEIQLWGSGPALLLRDGMLFQANWQRPDDGFFSLLDSAGNPLPVRPGKTWIQLVGLYSEQSQTAGQLTIRHRSPTDLGFLIGVETNTPTPEESATPLESDLTGTPAATDLPIADETATIDTNTPVAAVDTPVANEPAATATTDIPATIPPAATESPVPAP